jgi:hypothetical protein
MRCSRRGRPLFLLGCSRYEIISSSILGANLITYLASDADNCDFVGNDFLACNCILLGCILSSSIFPSAWGIRHQSWYPVRTFNLSLDHPNSVASIENASFFSWMHGLFSSLWSCGFTHGTVPTCHVDLVCYLRAGDGSDDYVGCLFDKVCPISPQNIDTD